jgi:hypothetical protein
MSDPDTGRSGRETALDAVDPQSDKYCMTCYEVIRFPGTDHRDDIHNGDMMVDIVPIQESSDGLIAKDSSMGHHGPHIWVTVDDHETCADCGGVKIKPSDVPDMLSESNKNNRTIDTDTNRRQDNE